LEIGDALVSLLIVSMIAFVIPMLTRRVGIPVIVGEIGFGILVGIINTLVHNWTNVTLIEFTPGGGLDLMAELGLIFLLFLAGLEIDINIIEEKGKLSLVWAALMFGITFGLCVAFIWLLDLGIYIALIMSTTSVGVVIPILR
jgi:Kef-type K+ transport system membrane component KefB